LVVDWSKRGIGNKTKLGYNARLSVILASTNQKAGERGCSIVELVKKRIKKKNAPNKQNETETEPQRPSAGRLAPTPLRVCVALELGR
jgi:hypothetical protein